MGFMDKFGTGQGWLARTFGKKTPQQTPQNIHTEVDSTMNDYNKTQSAFTQPTGTEPYAPNLGQYVPQNETMPNTSPMPNIAHTPTPTPNTDAFSSPPTPGNEAVTQNTMATQPSDYDMMISQFGKHWGQDKAGLENIMSQIGYHESKGENVYQSSGGPGAGIYQYETGKDQGGMTARNRLANWYQSQGKELPTWLNQEGMDEKGFDAALLTPEQQKMLFLADKRYHPTASLTPEATSNIADWWGKNHWAGAEVGSQEYQDKISGFRYAPTGDNIAGI